MAASKIRRAIGHVKDQTSISLAKVGSSSSVSDLQVAVVKATRHAEYPAEERHIREILSLTSYSRDHISVCVRTLSKRLNKTRNWIVALKTLMLIQRLLTEGDPAYEQEVFFSTRRGTRILNMSDFRDTSQSNSWDFSAFVRTYALYLDERLEFIMEGKCDGRRNMYGYNDEDHEDYDGAIVVRSIPVAEMKNEPLFSRLMRLQQLLDRFLACRPIGEAKCNRVVTVAVHQIVKESFHIYCDISEILGVLIDRFMDLDVSDSIKIYNIFCRERKQFDELDSFYSWCKSVRIARSSDYPEIEEITQKKLDLIDGFIRDKSALEQTKMIRDELGICKDAEPSEEGEDMKDVKALPAANTTEEEQELEKQEEEEEDNSKALVVKPKGDLLDLGEGTLSSQGYGDKLALALFDGYAPTATGAPSSSPGWEAFKDKGDWEPALVQSASNLKNQRATLCGGFDLLLLDSMYQQGTTMSSLGYANTGSASSVAFGSAERPTTLALPAPSSSKNIGTNVFDPFAASLTVEPPTYVQMSDMEKKQMLLMEEQAMWDQFRRGSNQGYGAMPKVHNYPYSTGGYTVWHGY